jgi:hypothetical protein
MNTTKHSRGLASARPEHERAAANNLQAAQNALQDARSSSSCQDVPKILAIAAARAGAAREALQGAVGGRDVGRKSGQLGAAIRKVDREIHAAVSTYAHGPCVRATPYDK